MKLNRFLMFMATIVGAALGNLLLSPSFGLELKLFILITIFAYAGIFTYCNSYLEKLDEEIDRRRIDALFGIAGEME